MDLAFWATGTYQHHDQLNQNKLHWNHFHGNKNGHYHKDCYHDKYLYHKHLEDKHICDRNKSHFYINDIYNYWPFPIGAVFLFK